MHFIKPNLSATGCGPARSISLKYNNALVGALSASSGWIKNVRLLQIVNGWATFVCYLRKYIYYSN